MKQMADAGDRVAQVSHGCVLMAEASGPTFTLSGAAGRSPKAEVGFGTLYVGRSPNRVLSKVTNLLCFRVGTTLHLPVAHHTKLCRCVEGHRLASIYLMCGCQP